MRRVIAFATTLVFACLCAEAQEIAGSPEYIKALTAKWEGNYPGKLPMSKEQLEKCLKERNF